MLHLDTAEGNLAFIKYMLLVNFSKVLNFLFLKSMIWVLPSVSTAMISIAPATPKYPVASFSSCVNSRCTINPSVNTFHPLSVSSFATDCISATKALNCSGLIANS